VFVRPQILLTLAIAGLWSGCSTIQAVGYREVPAAVPVQTFPNIVLLEADDADEAFVQLRVFERLQQSASSVEVLSIEGLEQRRREGRLRYPGVVVSSRLRMDEGFEDRWGQIWPTPPRALNTPSHARRGRRDPWPVVEGSLQISVVDIRSGQRFQRHQVSARDEGGDFAMMRRTVLERLAERLGDDMSSRHMAVPVRLERVPVPGNAAALQSAQEGRWIEARSRWLQLNRESSLRAAPPEYRASVLYNLAMATRFAAPSDQASLLIAEQALAQALELVPVRRYLEAWEQVQEHRMAIELSQRQRETRERNFELAFPSETSRAPSGRRDAIESTPETP